MIKTALVTQNPCNHFYNLLNGYCSDGIYYQTVPLDSFDSGTFDFIITDQNIKKTDTPIIYWFDQFKGFEKGDCFATNPQAAKDAQAKNIKCKLQNYFVQPRTNSGTTIFFTFPDQAYLQIKKELHWENFKILTDKNQLYEAKMVVINSPINIENDMFAAITRGWAIPIITKHYPIEMTESDKLINLDGPNPLIQAVKITMNENIKRANNDALIRAGMKYQNFTPINNKIKSTGKEKLPVFEIKETRTAQSILENRKPMVRKIQNKPKNYKQGYQPIVKSPYVVPRVIEIGTPNWFSKTTPVDVSVIIPMFRSAEVISDLIMSFYPEDIQSEFIFVNDACPMHSHQSVISTAQNKKLSMGRIIGLSQQSGFSTACNVGASFAKGKYLVFLNADTLLTPNWIKPMIDLLTGTTGMVGNMQLKQNGTIDSAGSEWSWQSRTFEHIGRNVMDGKRLSQSLKPEDAPKEIMEDGPREMVTGCCIAMEKELFDEVNGFDVKYRYGYWEDADLCMKIKEQRKKIMFTSKSQIVHKGAHSNSNGHPYMLDNARLFYDRWVHTNKIDQWIKAKRP